MRDEMLQERERSGRRAARKYVRKVDKLRWRGRLIKTAGLLAAVCAVLLAVGILTQPTAAGRIAEDPAEDAKIDAALVVITPEYIELPLSRTNLGEFKITAYCACPKCCGIWSAEHPSRIGTGYVQLTSSGTEPLANQTVAADWDVLPCGSVIYINGESYTVEDTGSGVNGKHIDIYFDDHQAALNWGVQYLEVFR